MTYKNGHLLHYYLNYLNFRNFYKISKLIKKIILFMKYYK